MKAAALGILAAAGLSACAASVQYLSDARPPPLGASCPVTVYLTRQQAAAGGELEELCAISGSSSGSFSHTIQTAIDKHKGEACGCGADKVYVESRADSGLSVATVTLIAFRYRATSEAD